MRTNDQEAWLSKLVGIDLSAVASGVKTIVQAPPGSAMLADCKPVKGKVPGPIQHLLCATHGHVVDIKEKKIIAISLEQYKSQKMGSATPAQAAAPAEVASNAAAAPADVDAAKTRAEVIKVLELMQSEIDEVKSIQKMHANLAGGGVVNRAVSWVSDLLGGADDPGDELAEISNKMAIEHFAGMGSGLDVEAAHKHLATMKALHEQAVRLMENYSHDTVKGGERAVTGLTVVSEAGDVATKALNVVAPVAGKVLSVAKNLGATGSKHHFGEKVNWTEFTVDMAFDLFVGRKDGQIAKAADKLAGPLAKKLAPKLSEALAKKLGSKVTEDVMEEYIKKEAEEIIKDQTKNVVMPIAEHVVESARDTDVTHEQLVGIMLNSMTDPSGQLAKTLSDKLTADLKP